MSSPIIPPFAVTASYQKKQYAQGPYNQDGSQVFGTLVTPPTSGTNAEAVSIARAQAVGFSAYAASSAVELVTVTGTPTGGTFTLTWGDITTSAIAYNATAATVQTALNALSSVPAATGGVNDVQTVTVGGSPTGGTYTLTFGGQTTGAIAYNAAASAVQTAFLALSSVGTGNATVTGSAGGPYTVTFVGTLGNSSRAVITATASLTGGTSPGVTVAHTTTGVANTPNIAVSGSAGGPYTVTFQGLLASKAEGLIVGNGSKLTGGTAPAVSVAAQSISQKPYQTGQSAFVNYALLNNTQHYDGLRNSYDAGSGNHF